MNDPNAPIEPQRKPKRAGGIGTIAAGAAILLAKFKTLLAVLLNFKFAFIAIKALSLSWTFLLSLGFYVLIFGWKLGVVVILLLAAHELGHYFAYRSNGLAANLPVFIPFFGAYTMGAIAPDLETDANIALAGPLTGLLLAGACYALGRLTGTTFWYACADISAFLNLFNMIPMLPFDGGRAIGAIWPPLWIAGVIILVAVAVSIGVPWIFIALIALLGLPAMWPALRGHVDPRAAAMTNAARVRVGLWYIVTALGLVLVLGASQSLLPQRGAL